MGGGKGPLVLFPLTLLKYKTIQPFISTPKKYNLKTIIIFKACHIVRMQK